MFTNIPGVIMGFREGLEAFLMITIVLQYLARINRTELRKAVYQGAFAGLGLSVVLGGVLYLISNAIQKTDEIAKIWESGASLIALAFVTTFIYWMIKHGRNMVQEVQGQVKENLSTLGLFTLSFIMVAREGTEIAIFTFAGQYHILAITLGIVIALVISVLIYRATIKVDLRLLFNITLGYLIIQAGFLLGYAVHEGLSALKALGILDANSFLFIKVFDLSKSVLDHKEGILGVPLYVLFGWYSRPEWIQFLLQYTYTVGMFGLWKLTNKRAI